MTTVAVERGTRPLLLRPFVAEDLVTCQALVLDVHMPIRKAAALLLHHEETEAPVVDVHGQPIGIVTTLACADWEDYSRGNCPHADHADCLDMSPVSNVMVPNIVLVPARASCPDIVEALLQHLNERVYVVDDHGDLIGAIDPVDALLRILPTKSLQLAS